MESLISHKNYFKNVNSYATIVGYLHPMVFICCFAYVLKLQNKCMLVLIKSNNIKTKILKVWNGVFNQPIIWVQ